MTYAAMVLDAASAVTGLAATVFWLLASRVKVIDPWPVESVPAGVRPEDLVFPTMECVQKSARLNQIAALLTAMSVLLAATASLAKFCVSSCHPVRSAPIVHHMLENLGDLLIRHLNGTVTY